MRWSIAEALNGHGHTVIEAPDAGDHGASAVLSRPFDIYELEGIVRRVSASM